MALETRHIKWWHREENKIICDLCPRNCRLQEGQRGFCFVRANINGNMALTTYGRSSGFCIDPIEKKPLNHFLPGTPVLSFGTAGCNLGCKFCQNWTISKSRSVDILSQEAGPSVIVQAALDHGCRSIAFTYNDPVIWAEYAIDVAREARQAGLKTVAVTAGYINPKARADFFEHIDATNIDLKAFSDQFYRRVTFSRLAPVLDALKWLKANVRTWFEISTLLIPGENDSVEEIDQMMDWVMINLGESVPLHFTAFHPDFKMIDIAPTPHETLIRARNQAMSHGAKFVYIGNVLDKARQSTFCSDCNNLLIERNHYELGRFDLKGGNCGNCGSRIAGVFEDNCGLWGRKRLPISICPTQVK